MHFPSRPLWSFAVALLIFSGVWPVVILYFVAALLMKPEPVLPLKTEGEQEFYNSYANSRRMALHRFGEARELAKHILQRDPRTFRIRE